MNLKKGFVALLLAAAPVAVFTACSDDDEMKALTEHQQQQIADAAVSVRALNQSALCYQKLITGSVTLGIKPTADGYDLDLSDGSSFSLPAGKTVDGRYPNISLSPEGDWMYSFDGADPKAFLDDSGKPLNAYRQAGANDSYRCPTLRIDAGGNWEYSTDAGKRFTTITGADGMPVSVFGGSNGFCSMFSGIDYNVAAGELALTMNGSGNVEKFPIVSDFYFNIINDREGDVFEFILDESRTFTIDCNDVEMNKTNIKFPSGWLVNITDEGLYVKTPKTLNRDAVSDTIVFTVYSPRDYVRTVRMPVTIANLNFDSNYCQAWRKWADGADDNVLLDFSYAGYMHGEMAPPAVETLGYKVFNVCDFGAVPDDGKSDREAFLKAFQAAGASRTEKDGSIRMLKNELNAIIYFPEGVYDLQCDPKEVNQEIHITAGNFILKGAGRDKTTIRMSLENKQTDPTKLWSIPPMMGFKHYSGLSKLTDVTSDAAKGSFSIEVGSTMSIKAGDWVCLQLKSKDTECINSELAPHPASDLNADAAIRTSGVEIYDYHQVASVSGNTVTFVEPVMHAVVKNYGWTVMKFPHYENVGVEDISFEGNCKDKFVHHGSAADDAAFIPIDFGRLTNSYMRRVNFINVSGALSVVNSANVSVYDIEISGRRGHSAVRSQASSRVFIGKVYDHTSGYNMETSSTGGNEYYENAGQYHGCGVSKTSMGAVIWNVTWGQDACFESHASQPRATLIDGCKGAFIPFRQGGDDDQMPNHLDDLIIWNMDATRVAYNSNWGNSFIWWDATSRWWKIMPPVIVGFHGQPITFGESFGGRDSQYKYLESNGTAVEPASLYEAQLRRRLGYVPGWLNELK